LATWPEKAGAQSRAIRFYEDQDKTRLRFICRARALDFGLGEIAELLDLNDSEKIQCKATRSLAAQHLETLRKKISALQLMGTRLEEMIEDCGENAPDRCAIIDTLNQT